MATTAAMALSFTVGAAVAGSFQSSFNILANRIQATQQKIVQLDKAFKEAEQSGAGMSVRVGQLLQNTQKKLTALTTVQNATATMTAAKGAFVSSLPSMLMAAMPIKTAVDFEQAMRNVGAVANASAEDIAKMTKQARELGAATVFSASDAAEGMQYLAMAGFNTEQTMAAMPGLLDLAAAGNTDLGRTSDIASNILSGFNLKAEEMARVSDVLTKTFTTSNTTLEMLGDTMKYVAPVAASVGMSVEDCAAAVGILGNSGIQSSQAGTVLRSALLRLSAPPTEAAKALESLGMSTKDAQGNVRPMVDILEELNEKTSKMGNAQKSGIFTKIFGMEAASGMVTLAASAGKQITDAGGNVTTELRDYMAKINNASGTAGKVATDRMKTTHGALEEMKSGFEDLMITIGNMFLPVLTKGMLVLGRFFAGLSEFAQKHSIISGAFIGITTALLAIKPMLAVFYFAKGAFLAFVGVVKLAGVYMNLLNLSAMKSVAVLMLQKAQLVASAVATGAMTAAQWLLNVALSANPIGLVIIGITALIAGMVALYKWCEPVRQVFDACFGWIGEKIGWVFDKFSKLGSAVKCVAKFFGFGGSDEAPAGGSVTGAGTTSASMPSMPSVPSVSLPSVPSMPSVGNGGIATPTGGGSAIAVNQTFQISGVNPENAKLALEAARPEFENLVRRVIKADNANRARVGYN